MKSVTDSEEAMTPVMLCSMLPKVSMTPLR